MINKYQNKAILLTHTKEACIGNCITTTNSDGSFSHTFTFNKDFPDAKTNNSKAARKPKKKTVS